MINPFDAPIPGESLTQAPGSQEFEKPPQFAKVEDALGSVIDNLLKQNNIEELILLVEQGLSVEEVVRTILMAGFSAGKWTPDVSMLMAEPLMGIVAAILKAADKGNVQMRKKKTGLDNKDKILEVAAKEKQLKKDTAETELPPDTLSEVPTTGFLSPKGDVNG